MSYYIWAAVGMVVGYFIRAWGYKQGRKAGRAVGFWDGYDYRKGQERRVGK